MTANLHIPAMTGRGQSREGKGHPRFESCSLPKHGPLLILRLYVFVVAVLVFHFLNFLIEQE